MSGTARWNGPLERVDAVTWRLPRAYRPGMRVDGTIFADDALLEQSIATNVRGLLWLMKAALPALVASFRADDVPDSVRDALGAALALSAV